MSTLPRCPYCLDDLAPEQAHSRCAACRTPHHKTCFDEHGGCVAFGCGGALQVAAGRSLYERAQLRVEVEPTHAAVGPFTLTYRRLPPVLIDRPGSFGAYARLSLEDQEVRAGGAVRGRAVIYVPRETAFRRVELRVSQGLLARKWVGRVALAGEDALLRVDALPGGSHPFALELRAPSEVDATDPFLFELALIGRLGGGTRSGLLPLFLLARRDQPAPVSSPDPLAERQRIRVAPLDRPNAERPAGEVWRLPIRSAGDLHESGAPTGRTATVRLRRAAGAPRDRITIEAPGLPVSPEVPIRVAGGPELAFLDLAVRYELVRPGGEEVALEGFPALDEVRLVGERAIPPAAYALARGLELTLRVPDERLAALAAARQRHAHNAALRLRLAVDAIGARGERAPAITRSVTFT